MKIINYTPIDDLIKKIKQVGGAATTKEGEPILASKDTTTIKESVEHEPDKDVKPFVKIRPESIKLPPDLMSIGLQQASSSQFTSYKNIKLPISDDKIVSGLHAPITSSLRWLAVFAIYLLQQAHLTLKMIHGHAVRIIRR